MARVRVLTGSHCSNRRAAIDNLFRAHSDRAVLLLPTHRLVHERRDTYMAETGLPGLLGAPFKTFDQLAVSILEREGICAETLSEFQRMLVVQEVIARLRDDGKLGAREAACITPGFATHALRTIAQLKQAGVDHNRFAEIVTARGGASAFDAVVSDVYTGYQNAVIDSGAYDRVGVIWQAETIARERAPKALKNADVILLDCFDDFTPSELRLIDALRAHVPEIVFGFAFNVSDPSQEDLYALPRETSWRVRTQFDVEFPEPCDESAPPTFSAFAAQHVFWRSRPSNAPQERNLNLIEYRDAWNEVEATGRAIKSLLLDGVDPNGIAVLHREISNVALAIRCTFTDFGIPFTLTADSPLRGSSIAGFVLELLEATDAWERDRIAAVIASRWFSRGATDADAPFLLARAAGIIEGHRDWSRGLEALHKRLLDDEIPAPVRGRVEHPSESCANLLQAVARLHELAGSFRTKDEESHYIEALLALMDALQANQTLDALPEPMASAEASAIECFNGLLRRWHAWSARNGTGTQITRAEFMTRLRRALRDTSYPTARDKGVWCAGMEEARHLEFDRVFLIGMNEGAAPRPTPVNAIYTQTDLDSFKNHDVELDTHQRHTDREMLLLHRCMSAAKTQLTVSWHVVDPGGKTRMPSPFIEDIKSVVEGGIEIESGGAPHAAPDRAASRLDLARSAPFNASERILEQPYVSRINTGAEIESERYRLTPFNRFDGIVEDERVKAALADRFGADHTFSVNQFETYASCPFRFCMERLLQIPEDRAPEAAVDARERGDVLHRVLRRFHERFRGKHVAELDSNARMSALDECIDDAFAPLLKFGSPHARALWSIERVRARKRLKRYLADTIEKDDATWKPDLFEVAFGRVQPDADTGAERLHAFALETIAGPIRFSGKIDRIDRAADTVRIVDYKSSLSSMTQKKVETSESLQLPVYGLAWNDAQPESPCVEASFAQLGKWKKLNAFTAKKGDWSALANDVRERIGSLAQRIREGHFPPDADKGGCHGCKARRACRYEQSRIERKRMASE